MHAIETERLRLPLVDLKLFDLCLDGNHAEAERRAGVVFDEAWLRDVAYLKRRRDQLAGDPAYAPWCTRMAVLKATNTVVGQIGFHTTPDPPGLRDIAPGGIEFGYRVYESFRRQGFAKEATIGLMRWAAIDHGIRSFVVSISPGNTASQALAKSLGFVKVTEQMDEVDGLEDVLLLHGAELAKLLRG